MTFVADTLQVGGAVVVAGDAVIHLRAQVVLADGADRVALEDA